ncbi:MAG: alpha-ketoacid dehydrogenase subunit beta [Bdellovibrionaceae bacterium]|nr:alpha-ketoacid dehydrogenase subunit beta [Bdellovibrio sp.]
MKFTNAINEALSIAMEADPGVIVYGLGTPDPKGIFGTTLGLQERFGPDRVFDMPTAENALTGVAIGAALGGLRPVMSHQRLDFFLLAMDQLVNNAAKWNYMFGGNNPVPITIRLIIGRGWGQGPTHSQSLQSWFAHIPGLKVVCPSSAKDAKELLLASIFDPNPVVFLEHRWLHNSVSDVPAGDVRGVLGKAHKLTEGDDVTVIGYSVLIPEALRAINYLKENHNINAELIDLKTISPLDWDTIFTSVKKTGRILAMDTSHEQCSVASEVISRVSRDCWSSLKAAPQLLALPNCPTPTSHELTKDYYFDASDIAKSIMQLMKHQTKDFAHLKSPGAHDVPGTWFNGPF